MKRVMCVYLPDWPLQRLVRKHPEWLGQAIVLVDRAANRRGPVVLHASHAARARSIRPGMPLIEAESLDRRLHVAEADPEGDLRALQKLAEWCDRYSPLVAVEEGPTPSSLLLDVTGCAAYFHGEDNLVRRVLREVSAVLSPLPPYSGGEGNCCVALADTIGAAWAVAHFGPASAVVPAGATENALRPLPVAALRLPDDTLLLLRELGIECVGQLLDLPRAELPGRFGGAVVQRLEQALGQAAEVLVPHRALPDIAARQEFEYGIERLDVVRRVVDQLAEEVAAQLLQRQRGARQLECWLHYEAVEPRCLRVALSRPSRTASHLALLVRTQLEGTTITEPIRAVSLRAPLVEPIDETQLDLFDSQAPCDRDLAALIDRLSSRLGPRAVTHARLVADPQPEYAVKFEPLPVSRPQDGSGRAAVNDNRPLRLWPRPVPIQVLASRPGGLPRRFSWKHEEYQVTQAWGPERIATGWWRGADIERDYYVVATRAGIRFWVYRRRHDGRWFVHGCFD